MAGSNHPGPPLTSERPPFAVAIAAATPECRPPAQSLALELALPLVNPGDNRFGHLLMVTPQRLELIATGPGAPGPIYAEFATGRAGHRRRFGGGRGQPLARAVGLKHGAAPWVLDATAGLGQDGFVLACLGCRVTLVERSPVVAALLRDGLGRAAADPGIGALVRERLRLEVADGTAYLGNLHANPPDVVYLDPMYPHRNKTALVKKEMRLLRAMVGDDGDASWLLSAALERARRRVVVKRPRPAPPLEGAPPTMAIEGENTRYDVYLTTPAEPG